MRPHPPLVDDLPRWNAIFTDLWTSTRPRLLGVARTMTGSTAEAEDVVQEAFCAAWRNRRGFLGASRPSTWLHRITLNAALMHLRTRRRRPTESLDPLAAPPPPLVITDDTLARAIEREQQDALRAALARLHPEEQTLLLADPADDVRDGTLTRSAWKSRRFRARRHLKREFAQTGDPP